MKDLLKYVPGFRTDTKSKKVVASIFYALHLLMSFAIGLDYFLIMSGLILFGFTLVQLVVNLLNKRPLKKPSLLLLAAILLFSTGLNVDSNTEVESKKVEEIKLVEEQRITEAEEKEQENLKLQEAQKEEERLKEAKLEEERIENERIEAERIAAEEQSKKEELELAEKLKIEEEEAAKAATPAPTKVTSSSGSGGGSSTGGSTQAGQGEVFITPTGSKYHARACGNGNYSATSLANAKSKGLTPCKKCY